MPSVVRSKLSMTDHVVEFWCRLPIELQAIFDRFRSAFPVREYIHDAENVWEWFDGRTADDSLGFNITRQWDEDSIPDELVRMSLAICNPSLTIDQIGRRLGVRTSYAAEWGWGAGRFGVIGAALLTTVLFLSESTAQPVVGGLLIFGSAYSTLLVYLLVRRRLRLVFAAGLVLDNSVMLLGWWVVARSFAGSVQTNDFWLILIPLVIVGVVRLGWVVGSMYTALWIGWMAWSLIHYYSPDSYDVEQLPVRIAFIVVIAGVVMRLVSLVSKESSAELDRLRDLERLEALKTTLLRTVAHEVRSPMTAIRAAAVRPPPAESPAKAQLSGAAPASST